MGGHVPSPAKHGVGRMVLLRNSLGGSGQSDLVPRDRRDCRRVLTAAAVPNHVRAAQSFGHASSKFGFTSPGTTPVVHASAARNIFLNSGCVSGFQMSSR